MPNDFWIRNQKWSVFWYSTKKKRYVRKRFQGDLAAALKFFKDNITTKPGITLHADNHGYPPPKRITEHEREKYIVVTRKGKKYKKKVTEVVNLMEEYNAKGIWWCPYCVMLRRFKETETERGREMYCPVCGCGNFLSDTRRYNPLALVIEMHKRQRRTTPHGKRRPRKV